jgi:proline iminopeptidase
MPVTHVNGTDLFYLEVGTGVPCLVMHGGLGMDHTYLHPWLNPLDDTMHLVYYDHRGNGRSGRPPIETLTLAQFAADADALRAHLGSDKVSVLGHSYGGFIALEYALRCPTHLSHLILVDTAPAFNYGEEVIANARLKGATEEMMTVLNAPNPTDDAEMQRALQVIAPLYFHLYDANLSNRMFGETVWSASAGARGEQLMAEYNVTPRLREVRVPTLILVGRDDFICPPTQAVIMRDGIPNSELVIFEQSGHVPYLEEPDAFFAAIRDWLRRTTGHNS